MPATSASLIAKIESYYAAVDDFDTDAIVGHFTADASMEIPTGDVLHRGHQQLRATYDRRATEVDNSFHGEFTHVVDAESGRAATRLTVRRTSTTGEPMTMDCIALFTFDGELIKQIVIWMSGANSLK